MSVSRAVVDSFALYRIVDAHTPAAADIREATFEGRLKLLAPAMVIAVTGAMRTCWDDECTERHGLLGRKLSAFCERSGIESGCPEPDLVIEAGRLYAASTAMRIEGPEVLAACHASRMASEHHCELLTASRAAYCYRAADSAGIRVSMRPI
ncbi:hypothetical protein ACH4SP_36620 [Streptomyces sp. NPDC021093]|uniref:hypothetical protein n=1 Tax=Streptomyces sp. NPDC021093 TaxID=3365112 RepID=UPI0037B0D414